MTARRSLAVLSVLTALAFLPQPTIAALSFSISDVGSFTVSVSPANSPTTHATTPLGSITPPVGITPIADDLWKITFIPSSQYFASANNSAGAKFNQFGDQVDIIISNATPFRLNSVQVLADGVFSNTPNAGTGVGATLAVTNFATSSTVNNFSPPPTRTADGFWTLSSLLSETGGFGPATTSYKITLGSALTANAFGIGPFLSTYGAENDLSLIISVTSNLPEPASLALLIPGPAVLLIRRRSVRNPTT